jgi:hypothetical protein
MQTTNEDRARMMAAPCLPARLAEPPRRRERRAQPVLAAASFPSPSAAAGAKESGRRPSGRTERIAPGLRYAEAILTSERGDWIVSQLPTTRNLARPHPHIGHMATLAGDFRYPSTPDLQAISAGRCVTANPFGLCSERRLARMAVTWPSSAFFWLLLPRPVV